MSSQDEMDAALREAEERGRRRQEVDSRLDDHDRRLKAINGSIERGAKATERLGQTVQELTQKVEMAAVVQAALAKSAASRRDLILGVLAIVAAVVAPHLWP